MTDCACRKPRPGMLDDGLATAAVASRTGAGWWATRRDVALAAGRAGRLLVDTGHGRSNGSAVWTRPGATPGSCADLPAAVDDILRGGRSRELDAGRPAPALGPGHRLRYLGDIVMSTVVLEVLRRGDPELETRLPLRTPARALLRGPSRPGPPPPLWRPRRRGCRRARPATGAVDAGDGQGTLGMVGDLRRRRVTIWPWISSSTPAAPGCCGWPASRCGSAARAAVAPPALHPHRRCAASGGAIRDFRARGARAGWATICAVWPPAPRRERPPLPRLVRRRRCPAGWRRRRLRPDPGARSARRAGELGMDPAATTPARPGATWPTKEWPRRTGGDLVRTSLADGHGAPVVLLAARRRRRAIADAADAPAGLPRAAACRRCPCRGPGRGRRARGLVTRRRRHHARGRGPGHARPWRSSVPPIPDIWFPYETLRPCRVLARAGMPSLRSAHRLRGIRLPAGRSAPRRS